jgi:hypothetical protein
MDNITVLWVIYISGTNNVQRLKQLCDWICVCVWEERGDSGYWVWLCVRWLLHRKVQCDVITAFCCHVFVPQYGHLAAVFLTGVISLRVSPKCTSHIKDVMICGIFTSAEQTTFNISNNVVIPLPISFLTCIVECVRVCRRRGGIADIECDWRCVLGDSYTGRYMWSNNSFLLSCVCSSVWSFGSHLVLTGV